MTNTHPADYQSLRKAYSDVVFSISNDLIFWSTFLPSAIEAYRKNYPNQARLFESGLFAYNIQLGTNTGWLHSLNHSAEINDDNLDYSRERFFQWIRLLSVVRIYNALEKLLFGIIETQYLPFDGPKHTLKKLKTLILTELTTENIAHDRKNNQFLLAFLRHRSPYLEQFFTLPVSNLTTSWETFFEFLSLIRHIIVHDSMVVSHNNYNLLNSQFGELMKQYFHIEKPQREENQLLFNEEKNGMQNLLSKCNDFAFNTIRFAFELDAIDS